MRNIVNLNAAIVTAAAALFAIVYTGFAQQPPAPAAPMPPILRNYQPVTAERLKNPEPGNWLMIRRTYDGWGYSPLDQITTQNVARLKPVWGFSTGETRVHESAPIINNGVMFVSTPMNQVIAIDAKTGNVLWRYRRPRPEGASVPHDTNRGVALYADKVYYAAGEAVLVALDAKTGSEVWTAVVADNKAGYYTSLAPLIASGKVMVGASGGERGIRGFVAAFDLDTGKELWRTYTVPAPGEPGSETWPKGDQWKTGGAPVWVTGNYDPETNLAFWGTGNGGPWVDRLAYANISPRTNEDVLHELCATLGYKPVTFRAVQENGEGILHTDVTMSIGDRFAIWCAESIADTAVRKRVLDSLKSTGREMITIDLKQLERFAGNVLQLQTKDGRSVLAISTSACLTLRPDQRDAIQKFTQIVESPLPLFEAIGRGSARCMMADVHLPRR